MRSTTNLEPRCQIRNLPELLQITVINQEFHFYHYLSLIDYFRVSILGSPHKMLKQSQLEFKFLHFREIHLTNIDCFSLF